MIEKAVVVIKIGSSVIANADGTLNKEITRKIVAEVAELIKTFRVILVSSGAVSSGKVHLKTYKGKLIERKAAAAIGNPILINQYSQFFSEHHIKVAQALFERRHFSNRNQFLQLKETIHELWKNDILTIVNENDIVSDHELKFSDNDELATLIAIAFNAETMLLCTTAGGYMDNEKKVIPLVDTITDDVLSFLRKDTSRHGTGGMASKLSFTKLATSLGIRVVICGVDERDSFSKAIAGKAGTTFTPTQSTLKDRQKWLASGSITIGSVQIDDGACEALVNRKSLLAIGVSRIERPFSSGEVVELTNKDNHIVGVAKMKLSSAELDTKTKERNIMAAHADDIVLF